MLTAVCALTPSPHRSSRPTAPTIEAAAAPHSSSSRGEPRIELRELRYFIAVAEELHFTRAARRLNIAQQALSSAIRRLELQLGGELFERTTREVRLTAAGSALLPLARQTLATAERAVESTVRALRGAEGTIRLGISRAAHLFGVSIAAAMGERYPRVELEQRLGFLPALIDDLHRGALDAVIADCAPVHPRLRTQRLSDEPAVVLMDSVHRLAFATSLELDDLRDELLVVSPDDIGRYWRSWLLELFARAGFIPSTAESSGFDRPRGTNPGETVAISSAVTLDTLPPAAGGLVRVPLRGVTMPFDLVWRAADDSPALATLRGVAAQTAARLEQTRLQSNATL